MAANQPQQENLFFVTVFFTAVGNRLQLVQYSDPQRRDAQVTLPHGIDISRTDLVQHLLDGPRTVDVKDDSNTPAPLLSYPKQLGCKTAAYIPILQDGDLRGLIMVGAREGQTITEDVIDAFKRTVKLTANIHLTRTASREAATEDRKSSEIKALSAIAAIAISMSDLQSFCKSIHEHIQGVVGDYGLVVALYDSKTNSISVPYLYEDGNSSKVETFPLGEGLTSIIIRTREPLMLVEDTMNRATAMGAKISGKPARSWLGVPLIAQGEPIGAIIIQDVENENSFDENDLEFMVALANQISGPIYNNTVLEESRQTALQFETAAEIARDISSSLDLNELLQKAVNLIRSRFNFYHAGVFLKNTTGDFVVIREATGEAGAQLKRAGHKLGVGSKSVVGFAAGNGEQLIVNDTTRDVTYYPNPLLPDTRSEAAIPLVAGERIVGVLDVQSDIPFSFSAQSLKILQILADQLAIAVVNTELFAETQEHLAQHRLLHHITTTAASGTTLSEALQSAVNGLQVTLGGDRVSILLADRDKKNLEVKAAVGYGSDIFDLKVPIGAGITGWSAKNKRSLRSGNVHEDTRYIEGSASTVSELAIPMIYRSELLGILNVESELSNAYSESDEELFGTLGGSLAAIIANARLLEQIRSQAERERIVFEITDKIRKTTDLQTILTTTASELARTTGANKVTIKVGADQENQTGKSNSEPS